MLSEKPVGGMQEYGLNGGVLKALMCASILREHSRIIGKDGILIPG